MKPGVIQSFLAFDFHGQNPVKCDHSKANFTQFVMLENLSILDLALSGVKGLKIKKV